MPPLPRLLVVALSTVAAGCEFEPPFPTLEPDAPPPAAVTASAFDPADTGRITGRVTWTGPPPFAPAFVYGVPEPAGNFNIRLVPNPNAPQIDPKSQAVGGAVVFLRGVNPARARPWDHPPARVEMTDRHVRVRQGTGGPGRVAFVRRGDIVPMVSVESAYHVLRGRGAEFFSYTFPEPNQERSRRFDRVGRVELTSGAGYYWAVADLFVDDHPYYTVSGPDGRFTLEQVPTGPVEVVAWLPNWNVAKQERDPESGMLYRQTYAPPLETARKVVVDRGQPTEAAITLPPTPAR